MRIAATLSPTLQKTQWGHKEKYMAESKIQQTLAKTNICRFYIISFCKPYSFINYRATKYEKTFLSTLFRIFYYLFYDLKYFLLSKDFIPCLAYINT